MLSTMIVPDSMVTGAMWSAVMIEINAVSISCITC